MPLIIELEKRRWIGMVVLQVKIVDLRLSGGVTAILADVHLKGFRLQSFLQLLSSSRLPLTSFACSRTDEPPRALLGSGFLVNNVGWKIFHRDCTCRVELLKSSMWMKSKVEIDCQVNLQTVFHIHLYEFLCVFSSQRCRWSPFHRRYKDSVSHHCGTSCVGWEVAASWNLSGRLCTWTCRPPPLSLAPLSQALAEQGGRVPMGFWSRALR